MSLTNFGDVLSLRKPNRIELSLTYLHKTIAVMVVAMKARRYLISELMNLDGYFPIHLFHAKCRKYY